MERVNTPDINLVTRMAKCFLKIAPNGMSTHFWEVKTLLEAENISLDAWIFMACGHWALRLVTKRTAARQRPCARGRGKGQSFTASAVVFFYNFFDVVFDVL